MRLDDLVIKIIDLSWYQKVEVFFDERIAVVIPAIAALRARRIGLIVSRIVNDIRDRICVR